MRLCGLRKGIIIDVTPADRARLQSIIPDRNSPQKHVSMVAKAIGMSRTTIYAGLEELEAPITRRKN